MSTPTPPPAPPKKSGLFGFLKFGCLLVVVAGLVLVSIIILRPSNYTIVRTATIDSPPEKVFERVNDFKQWEGWSPWAKLDPNVKNTYSEPPSGKGATMAWVGNDEVGEGGMVITESTPSKTIKIDLEFKKPFPSKSVCHFEFVPAEEGKKTQMTWTMTGEHDFMGKAFTLFVDMDKMIGKDFENGLANMNSVSAAK